MNHSIHFQSNIFQRKLIDIFFLIKLKTAVTKGKIFVLEGIFYFIRIIAELHKRQKATIKEPQCGNKKLTPIPFVLIIHNNVN